MKRGPALAEEAEESALHVAPPADVADGPAAPSLPRPMWRRWVREPLVHFLLIGAALFALNAWKATGPAATPASGSPAEKAIVVTRGDIDQMVEVFTKTWQRPPDADEQKALIDDFVRNEIYFREALALGLEKDDAVVRRRLRQKMEFLQEDVASWSEPGDAELRAFAETRREKYLADPEFAFRHVYVDSTRRGGGADAEAQRLLGRLNSGADFLTLGDRTMLEPELPLTRSSEIGKIFGESFAASLASLPVKGWSGPVRSGYGLHLVFISARTAGRMPEWSSIRERVKQDWTVERQRAVKDAAYAKLRTRYKVVVEAPAGTAAVRP